MCNFLWKIRKKGCVSYLEAKKYNWQEEETLSLSVNSCTFLASSLLYFECKCRIKTLNSTAFLFQLNEPQSETSPSLDIVELDFTFYGGQISLEINDLTTHVIMYSEWVWWWINFCVEILLQ
jgi:hypothetical protein